MSNTIRRKQSIWSSGRFCVYTFQRNYEIQIAKNDNDAFSKFHTAFFERILPGKILQEMGGGPLARRKRKRLHPLIVMQNIGREMKTYQIMLQKGGLVFLFHYFCSHPNKILFVRVLMRQSAILSRVCNIVGILIGIINKGTWHQG